MNDTTSDQDDFFKYAAGAYLLVIGVLDADVGVGGFRVVKDLLQLVQPSRSRTRKHQLV